MPRQPDSHLEERIINAAYKLWVNGGEHALTMRAVAKEAGTTTPTLYERFKDKSDLLAALRVRAQRKLFDAIQPARSITEACRIALVEEELPSQTASVIKQACVAATDSLVASARGRRTPKKPH